MQTRISHILLSCLTLLACFCMSAKAQTPEFPSDPGELYIPSVIVIMGDTVTQTDLTEVSTVIDVLKDSTILYDTEENVLTLTSANLSSEDSLATAIKYEGSEPLVIVLCDSSSIIADTVITSMSDVIITGDGTLIAEGVVPLRGAPTATITFDSVSMYVRALPSSAAVRRRVRGVKQLDEDGGPALSGFASADFNKTSVTPPDAEYGEVEVDESAGGSGLPETINALYVVDEDGNVEVLDEFTLTADSDTGDALRPTYTHQELDVNKPMYNILGLQVGASYKGIIIQQGQTYLLQ